MSGIIHPAFFITTLGCKLNFAESAALVRQLAGMGWTETKQASLADFIIVHSCAVTHVAEKKTRQSISKLIKTAPLAEIVVTGCMVDVHGHSLSDLLQPVKHRLIVNALKMQIPALLSASSKSNTLLIHPDTKGDLPFSSAYSIEQRTRSFLKIQDGCNHYCTYCTVPYARGNSRSHTIEGVLQNIQEIQAGGIREIVLTGVNIGTFGIERGESFAQLLNAIDNKISHVRIRLGSTEPELLSTEIIERVAGSSVLMPHFHLPLQSGCDATLKRMHRRYDTSLFREKTELIRQMLPDACIAADVITGFPGETDDEFEQTFHFIESLDISYLHVFPYSDRPLAKASQYDHKVKPHEIRIRVGKLLELGQKKQLVFFETQQGKSRMVLFESSQKDGYRYGFTDNYIRVRAAADQVKENELRLARLDKCGLDWMECSFT